MQLDGGAEMFVGRIVASRMESLEPSIYRLARKSNGDVVLQGAYRWTEGQMCGHTWRDIPTVELTETGDERG